MMPAWHALNWNHLTFVIATGATNATLPLVRQISFAGKVVYAINNRIANAWLRAACFAMRMLRDARGVVA
jgi:hypothetical protein